MAGYAYIGQITDPNAQKAIKNALDLIVALRAELDALKASALTRTATVDAGGQRIRNVADPQANTDAASAGYVKAYISAQLESFKGQQGVDGSFTTPDPFTVVVVDGLVTSIT